MDIFKSKKFLTLLLDTAVSITLHFTGNPNVIWLIAAIQPVFVALIAAYATQEIAAMRLVERMDEIDVELLMERLANK